MDGIHGGEPGMMHFLQDQNHNGLHHHHMSNGNAIDQDEHGENNNIGTSGGVDGDVGANMGSQTDNGALIPHVGGSENGDQLTLSFQGQVYVFDSVSPEKVDRISLLPDEVLVSILCLLSFKEATATSILGRRWRYLHTWTRKLDLDGSELLTKQGQMSCKTLMNWFNELRCDDYFTWADCLMAKHNNSTLEEFRVFYGLDRSNAQHLDEWLRFALSKRVERLELNLTWKGHVDLRNHHAYTFPYKRVVGEGFSFLKKLSTSYVNVGGEAVEGLLRNCPHLQQLSLDQPGDLTSLEIVSTFPSFKRLEICLCLSLTSLVIRDSSIVCLRVYTGIRIQHVALTNVPLLTELSFGNLPLVDLGDMFSSVLPQIRMLELFFNRRDLSEEESRNFCSRIELSNLKQFVVVDDDRNDLKEIVVGDEGRVETPLTPLIHLLNASPRLEKFVVKSAQYLDDWEYERKSEEDIPFYKRGKIPRAERKTARAELAARKTPTLYPCLKEVEWVGYVDMESYFEMVMHLVGNGVALENIVVDQRDLVYKLHGRWDFYPPHKTTPRLQAMADALRNYVPSRINLNIIS